MTVTNKARVEGSIVEACILKEISSFCSHYFDHGHSKDQLRNRRHDVGPEMPLDGKLAIFNYPGCAKDKGVKRTLDMKEFKAAHRIVLGNSGCEFIENLSLAYNAGVRATSRRPIDEATLKSFRDEHLSCWVLERTQNDQNCDIHIKRLCRGPIREVKSYGAYDINGLRFHTQVYGQNRKTNNSGVCIHGEKQDYYGILDEIVELEHSGGVDKIVLFKCSWFDPINGIRVDNRHGLVEVKHTSRIGLFDPFVLACQAIQVYYLTYASDDRGDWWVAMKTRRKPNWGHQTVRTENRDIFQEEWSGCSHEVSGGEDIHISTVLVQQDVLDPVDPDELARATSHINSMQIDDESGYESEEQHEFDNEESTDPLGQDDEEYGW